MIINYELARYLCWYFFFLLVTGPVTRSRRMLREIHGEITDTNVQNVTNFIADTCLYDGTQVSRTSITCEKKHGCRAIQKTGECCPDYQCECQRDGKVYSNGEKVFDPETPCRVCYCQGGEISCSQVSCYKRHDCEPKFIPGRCCPEYDNCPPLENSNTAEPTSPSSVSSELKETEIDAEDLLDAENKKLSSITSNDVTTSGTTTTSSTTTSTTTATTEGSTPAKLQIPAASNNPLGIKIKEITKPEEIRLTDSRPKITTTTNSASSIEVTAHPSTEVSSSTSGHSEEANNLEHLDLNVTDDGDVGMKNVRHTEDELTANATVEFVDSNESSTAGPSDSSPSSSDEVESSSESISSTTARMTAPPTMSTTTAMPDDVSDEVTKKDKPLPAVVQIGDKLVIVDHNQPKPITVIQVEEVAGLQRGDDDISYDQEMYTDRAPETPKQMKLDSGEGEMLSTQADSSVAFETVYHGGSTENLASEEVFETQHYTEGPETSAERNETQGDQLSASSEEFIQLPASSDKPARLEEEHTTLNSLATSVEEGSTTLADLAINSASSEASGDEVYETHFYTEGPGSSSETTEVSVNAIGESSEAVTPMKELQSDDMATQRKPYIEDDEHDLIQPGFQPIPEDFSLPLRDQPAMDDDMEPSTASAKSERKENVGTPKILSEVFEYKHNVSSTTETSNETESEATISPSWLKDEPKAMFRAPGEPHLIPEWERNNVTVSNSSSEEEFSGAGEFHVLKMNSEEYMDSSSEGSGASSTRKEPEETTLAPSKSILQDIDSSESGSLSESDSVRHNPKNDAESVKYDEDENSTVQEALPKQVKSSV
ncbi:AAEL001722-PA [Aedes aegypti]|uniref:AAEL001722-PA n=1 Tax=Aedes aegypti TaxID=7159 RepID=Q17KC9_AEDAE|nr:AAEL001722-PA [Aedes aegypti]